MTFGEDDKTPPLASDFLPVANPLQEGVSEYGPTPSGPPPVAPAEPVAPVLPPAMPARPEILLEDGRPWIHNRDFLLGISVYTWFSIHMGFWVVLIIIVIISVIVTLTFEIDNLVNNTPQTEDEQEYWYWTDKRVFKIPRHILVPFYKWWYGILTILVIVELLGYSIIRHIFEN